MFATLSRSLVTLVGRPQDDADRRKSRRGLRPALDSLEGRVVLSTVPGSFIGPVDVAAFSAATTPPPTTTITTLQNGTAFGMDWVCTWDARIGQYRLDIQGGAGGGNVEITRTKVGIQFQASNYNSTTNAFETVKVTGPALHQDKFVQVRQFRDQGDINLSLGSGIYRSLSTLPRTTTSSVNTPTGQIGLTYRYDCIANTGKLTVNNIQGNGRVFYSKELLNPNPGDPTPDSPSANPVQSIQFQLDGTDYNGGLNVFVPGRADATITVSITNNNRAGYYQLVRGAW